MITQNLDIYKKIIIMNIYNACLFTLYLRFYHSNRSQLGLYRLSQFEDFKRITSTFLKTQYDSSSLTNEKDHHYFLNSADVCW